MKTANETVMILSMPFITDGTTAKVSQFIMPLKSVHNIELCLNKQICTFKHWRKIKIIYKSLYLIYGF